MRKRLYDGRRRRTSCSVGWSSSRRKENWGSVCCLLLLNTHTHRIHVQFLPRRTSGQQREVAFTEGDTWSKSSKAYTNTRSGHICLGSALCVCNVRPRLVSLSLCWSLRSNGSSRGKFVVRPNPSSRRNLAMERERERERERGIKRPTQNASSALKRGLPVRRNLYYGH